MRDWDSEESTEHLLKRAYLAMRSRTDLLLAEVGLTLPQAEVLAYLWKGGSTCLRDLGTHLGTQPATLKGILDGLERRGLVVRREDPVDARIKRLHLTPEGERLKEQVPALCTDVQDRALRGFSPETAAALQDWLTRITRNLEGTEPGTSLATPLWETA